jgi:thiol-disulfide isomerase/thioredoxin
MKLPRSAFALAVTIVAGSATATAAPPDSSLPAGPAEPCTPAAATGPTEPPSTQPELPAWQTLEIVDVDGVTFTLADCIGTPVLVETFATWCSNCREQMPKTQEAAATLGENAAVIALSVETELSPDVVAEYAVDLELPDVRFAVMSPELLAALVEAFGPTVANPPSTPKIVIDAAGIAGELTTGGESVEDLVAQLAAAAPVGTVATTTG